ncbi:MAG: peptidase M14 [Cyclobacteriaceae bacterium]|nr:peptidase M14 [Cyclobacteriaceae bacterium]
MAQNKKDTVREIVSAYSSYHFNPINTNLFRHADLMEAIEFFEENQELEVASLGCSEEGREIKTITYGRGKTKVLLWSQMHGNESTATRAILDLLVFFTSSDAFNSLRKQLADSLTLVFIPMLNPDGAERFQRRTSTEIDMNRDAIALQTPEARLLKNTAEQFKPDFAFNLHDQRRFYNVGNTGVPSSLSFLAPAFDQSRKVNKVREKAMQVIAGINEYAQEYIPGGVGLYDDAYSHRSFGDFMQSKGISTILVESGWIKDDPEKEAIRKLNFASLLKGFELIASAALNQFSVKDYSDIPSIDTKLFDVLIKNAGFTGSVSPVLDIGINRTEQLLDHPHYFSIGKIDDLGDLSSFFGFETIDATQLKVAPGKAVRLSDYSELSTVSVKRLLRQGVLFLITEQVPLESHVAYPVNIIHPRKLPYLQHPVFEGSANFLLVDQSKTIKYIVMNGFVFEPDKINESANGLVIS